MPRPPHRSVRAAFPHAAPISGIDGGTLPSEPTPCDTLIRLRVQRVLRWSTFPLVSALRSTNSAADHSALFIGFPATMTESDFSGPCIIGYGSSPSRCGRQRQCRSGQTRDLPVSVQRTSPRAQGLRLRKVLPMQAIPPWEMLPSLQRNEIGTSEVDPFRSSILGPWSPL
jgi:hypothetical protein